MKRLVAAAALFLLIITVCFAGNYTVLKNIDGFKSKIDNCKRLYLAGETDAAIKSAEDFSEEWYKYSKKVSAFSNHRLIDEIGVLASALPEAAKENNRFEFASITARIKAELKMIYKEQSLNPENFY